MENYNADWEKPEKIAIRQRREWRRCWFSWKIANSKKESKWWTSLVVGYFLVRHWRTHSWNTYFSSSLAESKPLLRYLQNIKALIIHAIGMYNIARKNTLGIHLRRFQKEFPKAYSFFPMTWLYPSDFCEINEFYNKKL